MACAGPTPTRSTPSSSASSADVAVGIPVPPVTYAGVTYQIGQANNALLFPGLGLGTIVADASRVTPGMLRAAAQAVADQVDVATPGASLLPSVENLGDSSAITAAAVVGAAVSDGVAVSVPADPDKAVREARWQPVYLDGTLSWPGHRRSSTSTRPPPWPSRGPYDGTSFNRPGASDPM